MMNYKIHGLNKLPCQGEACGKEEPEFTTERDAALRHWELTCFKIVHASGGECVESWWKAIIPDSIWRDSRFQAWIDDRRGHDKERVK